MAMSRLESESTISLNHLLATTSLTVEAGMRGNIRARAALLEQSGDIA
jgi:hypothetical protein